MAFHTEKPLSNFAGISILIFAFLALFQPWQLHFAELSKTEGLYAAVAAETEYVLAPAAIAHGTAISTVPPSMPWLSGLLSNILPVESSLRLLPIAALAIASVLAGLAAGKVAGSTAGFTAAAMVFSTNLVLEKFLEFDPLFCAVPFLMGGWLLWFYYGYQQGNWDKAWIVFALCAGLGVYTGGYKILPVAIIPLVFQRRPLSIKRKLRRQGALAALLILAFFLLAITVPWVTAGGTLFDWSKMKMISFADYGWQLLSFPVDFGIRLLPWGLIAWAPFCVAYQWIAPAPIFGKFLRTIVISVFFFFWLTPGTEITDTAVLIAPLAVLTGIYARYPFRKYGHFLTRLLRLCAMAFAIMTFWAGLLYFYRPAAVILDLFRLERSIDFLTNTNYQLFFIVSACAITVCISAIIQPAEKRLPLWAQGILLTAAFMLCKWSIIYPYQTQEQGKRDMGKTLAAAVAEVSKEEPVIQPVIYKLNINEFYSEAIYSGIPFREIRSMSEVPSDTEGVFVLTTEFPQFPEREWRRLLVPTFTYRDKPLVFLYGKLSNQGSTEQHDLEAEGW